MSGERAFELDLVGLAVDRLEAATLPGKPEVVPALSIGEGQPPRTPAVLVYLAADDGTESAAPSAGAYQRVTAILAVVHVVAAPNTRRRTGDTALDPIAELAGCTRAVLNGWKPRPERARQDVLTLRRGRLIEVAAGRAVWQDEYTVSWRASRVQDDN